MVDFKALSEPFPPEAIHWRAQLVVERNGSFSALALAYIDARDVMNRLDEVCGPAGWTDSYVETAKGRTIGTIAINVDGEWISKSDGAGDTDVEGEKGSLSDAMKRTAVKWGIGRYLYRLSDVWGECEPMRDREGQILKNNKGKPQFKRWTPNGLKQLAASLGGNAPSKPREKPAQLVLSGEARETDHRAWQKLNEVSDYSRLALWYEDHAAIINSADEATKAVLRATYAEKVSKYPKPKPNGNANAIDPAVIQQPLN